MKQGHGREKAGQKKMVVSIKRREGGNGSAHPELNRVPCERRERAGVLCRLTVERGCTVFFINPPEPRCNPSAQAELMPGAVH